MTRLKASTCDAPGCELVVSRGKLMCRAHWFATPSHLRRAISDAWQAKRITEWSGHCLEARAYHAGTERRRAAITADSTRKHEA
jgi:hypothetical protein